MRILIADDHELFLDTLVAFFERQPDMLTSTAKDLEEALVLIEQQEPFDLVLLDLNMPGMNGLEGLTEVLVKAPGVKVALLSGTASRDVGEQALTLGAAGFLPKTLPAKSLINAMRFIAMGEQYAPIDFMNPQKSEPTKVNPLAESLSKRELQVLEGLCLGSSNKEISRELGISEPTIKLHVKTLYRKIGVANRTQAAVRAKEAGLF